MRERYHRISDLPGRIPIFPLRGAILLPRVTLPLNVFEPRYLAMIDDVLSTPRLVGIVQPQSTEEGVESPAGKSAPLRRVGGLGRVTSFSETDDGRYLVSLTGICRFHLIEEMRTSMPYRMFQVGYEAFGDDLVSGFGEGDVDRAHFLKVLKAYLEANDLKADWQAINSADNELLINTLSMISPYGCEEKQALLEARNLKARAEALVALAEMELAGQGGSSGSTLQ
ncbi:MAG: LON peptidase substrate-binding domain-containing protein [Hyphomicrobiaceae bacterium]